MYREIYKYNGFYGLVKPGETEVEFKEISWEETEESKDKVFSEIIRVVSGSDEGKITNLGYLPSPIDNFTAFVDFNQFDKDKKYNWNMFGNPIYGNILFLFVDKESENGNIYPIEKEEDKETLSKFIHNMKKFELDTGIYKTISETDKEKFLKEFIEEKNNVLKESTEKNIVLKTDEEKAEYERAKEELKQLNKEGKITDEMKEEFNLHLDLEEFVPHLDLDEIETMHDSHLNN